MRSIISRFTRQPVTTVVLAIAFVGNCIGLVANIHHHNAPQGILNGLAVLLFVAALRAILA